MSVAAAVLLLVVVVVLAVVVVVAEPKRWRFAPFFFWFFACPEAKQSSRVVVRVEGLAVGGTVRPYVLPISAPILWKNKTER